MAINYGKGKNTSNYNLDECGPLVAYYCVVIQ